MLASLRVETAALELFFDSSIDPVIESLVLTRRPASVVLPGYTSHVLARRPGTVFGMPSEFGDGAPNGDWRSESALFLSLILKGDSCL